MATHALRKSGRFCTVLYHAYGAETDGVGHGVEIWNPMRTGIVGMATYVGWGLVSVSGLGYTLNYVDISPIYDNPLFCIIWLLVLLGSFDDVLLQDCV
jgi:hypothetical protein